MIFDKSLLFWPGLALLFAIPTIVFIPLKNYKKFFLFGFVFGGLIDIVTIFVIGKLLGEFSYRPGPLVVLGIPIFIPLAFTFTWMIFFYFLPIRMEFLVSYIIGFSGFAVLVGFVEQNLGYFQYHHGFVRGATMTMTVFFLWFSFSAWAYRYYLPKLPSKS